jgi:hypothetical protein
MSIFVNHPSESTIKDIGEHHKLGEPSSSTTSEDLKSRNLVNSHEYFSFSNQEEKDKMDENTNTNSVMNVMSQ